MKRGLKKRVFLLFISFTISIILILTFFELLLVRNIIFQYEKQNIDAAMEKVESSVAQYNTKAEESFKQITQKMVLGKEPNYEKIFSFAKENLNNKYVVIYDNQQQLVQGQIWELIDKYKKQIFRKIGLNLKGSFVISYGNQSFWVDYYSLFDSQSEDFYGIVVTADNFEELAYPPDYFKLTFPLQPEDFPKSNFINFQKKLSSEVENNKKNLLLRTSNQNAYGIKILYDISQNPQLAICYHYQRNFNEFAQKSLLVSLLLIAGVILLVIVFFGNWFSRQIFSPIQFISHRMQEIIKNPKKLEQIENIYQGELGDMVSIFNEMERSLTQYSRNLEDYKIISDNLDSGVFWLDDNLNFKLCNQAMANILDTTVADILGKNLEDFISLSIGDIKLAKHGSLLLPNLEIEVNGERKFTVLNTNALLEGDSVRVVGILADITKEIKNAQAMERLELELIKSNKLADIGKKVEGIVHNINSPLNSILGYAQLMKKEQPDNPDLVKIIKAGKNISHQVKELLRKVKENDIALQRLIDVNKLLRQELSFLEHNIYFKHHIELDVKLAADLPKITAVYSDISQAIANVMNNAIEALENSVVKKINIATYTKKGYVCVCIEDSGEGIADENKEMIFQPNYTTKLNKKGTGFGLGLAITNNIIEKYHGKIIIETEKGLGSTFVLMFPANKE